MVSQDGSYVRSLENPNLVWSIGDTKLGRLLLNADLIPPEFVLECYPKTVMPGDTLYVTIIAKNSFDEPIHLNRVSYYNAFQVHVKDSKHQQSLHTGKNLNPPGTPARSRSYAESEYAEIMPGDSHVFITYAVNVPPLEDLKEPFWEKHLKNLPTGDEEFLFCVTFRANLRSPRPVYIANYDDGSDLNPLHTYKRIQPTVETPITIKQRPEKEMALIQNWYESLANYLESDEFLKYGVMPGSRFNPIENVIVKKEKFRHWFFVRIGNFYPNTTDIPETWQGWKELEESLAPSTMRDEIRLTRILIQYCDTGDAAALKDIKEWFSGMNEVQRTVLATSLQNKAYYCYGQDEASTRLLFPPFREIYKTIREYDKTPVPKILEDHLRNLRLIE